MVVLAPRRLLVAPLVVACLVAGCVDINPDWDESSVDASSGTVADIDASSADGDGAAGASTSESSQSSGAAGDGVSPDDACLQAGLARCEDETMDVCVDLMADPHHCGACFHGCAEIMGSTCVDGECACPGGEWFAVCGGACRDVKNDPRACGHACVDCTRLDDGDPRCKNGVCEFGD